MRALCTTKRRPNVDLLPCERPAEAGQVTGTQDKDYNLMWFTEQCLSNALWLETYVQDADRDGDSEVADLFRKAQAVECPRFPGRCR